MRKTLLLLTLGYTLSVAMFLLRQSVVEALGWPPWLFVTIGLSSGIGFYLLVNTVGDGANNSRTYQWLAFGLAALYALAACGDYSPVALLSTGPILVGCFGALLENTGEGRLHLKNGRRFLIIAALSAAGGVVSGVLWVAPFPQHFLILWGFGGIGLVLEATAQIAYMGSKISPKQFRLLQMAACVATLFSCLAQSNVGSVAFNSSTLFAMAAYAISDQIGKQQNPPSSS